MASPHGDAGGDSALLGELAAHHRELFFFPAPHISAKDREEQALPFVRHRLDNVGHQYGPVWGHLLLVPPGLAPDPVGCECCPVLPWLREPLVTYVPSKGKR